MKSAKRKVIAQNFKFKYIVLSIGFYLYYLVYYIAKRKDKEAKTKT
jgi:hypothetical protein